MHKHVWICRLLPSLCNPLLLIGDEGGEARGVNPGAEGERVLGGACPFRLSRLPEDAGAASDALQAQRFTPVGPRLQIPWVGALKTDPFPKGPSLTILGPYTHVHVLLCDTNKHPRPRGNPCPPRLPFFSPQRS